MRILVALGDLDINSKIKEKYPERVSGYGMSFKEEVLEFLSKKCEPHIIVTKEAIDGEISFEEYIRKIKSINQENKIIILTDKLVEKRKHFLFSYEVFNIIEGNEIDINLIYKAIDNNEKVIYKTVYKNIISSNKKKVAIFGSNGAGKSFVCSLISKIISKYSNLKVLVVNFDVENSCIDIFNNLSTYEEIEEEVLKDSLVNKKELDKYIFKDIEQDNLFYIGVKSENKFLNFNEVEYEEFFCYASERFDYILIDLPANILSTKANCIFKVIDDVFFVLNSNYISLRQSQKYIEFILNHFNVSSDKIKLFINKQNSGSLDQIQVQSKFKYLKVACSIRYFKEIDEYINGIIYKLNVPQIYKIKILEALKIDYVKNKFLIGERWYKNAKQSYFSK